MPMASRRDLMRVDLAVPVPRAAHCQAEHQDGKQQANVPASRADFAQLGDQGAHAGRVPDSPHRRKLPVWRAPGRAAIRRVRMACCRPTFLLVNR